MGVKIRDLSLYEKKIIKDEEFPVQMFKNQIRSPGVYFQTHWHEHLELHYVLKGTGYFVYDRKNITVKEGSLVIFNSNVLHQGISEDKEFDALVIIFEMSAFSKEIADYNVIFQSLIEEDDRVQELLTSICKEDMERNHGYKLAIKGKLYELITYLFRNYVTESLSARENTLRLYNLGRINTVVQYIQENYSEPVTNRELADLIHLSEYRFCHLFKESMGKSPINYINEVRLKKAYELIKEKENSISEVAVKVGFSDYNNFGRLFRKYYGFPPSKV